MDSADRKRARSTLMMLGMFATLGLEGGHGADRPDVDVSGHQAHPAGYGVHLSKAERRGKSFAELQALREERKHA